MGDASFTSVPDHLPNSTRLPAFTSSGTSLPVSSRAPGPRAMTSPSIGFSLAVSGMIDGEELLIMKESDIMGIIEGQPAAKRKAA